MTGGGISAGESATIDSALTVGAPQTWTVASGEQLTVSGSLNLNISSLSIVGGGNTLISGPIHDAYTDPLLGGLWTGPVGTLTMAGSGVLTLSSSANTYSGNTVLSSGTLSLGDPLALQNSTVVINGGFLDLHGYNAALGGLSLAGSFALSSGTMNVGAGNLRVDSTSGGGGLLGPPTGGTGQSSTGNGLLSLSGSALLSVAGQECVGYLGSGTLTQSGGTNAVGSVVLGKSAGSSGTYNLRDGLLALSSLIQGSGSAG